MPNALSDLSSRLWHNSRESQPHLTAQIFVFRHNPKYIRYSNVRPVSAIALSQLDLTLRNFAGQG